MKGIFLDIDGTLTPLGSSVPPDSAAKAISAARARGHKVFLCTSRSMPMLAPLLPYGFDGVVASAGGHVEIHNQVLFDCPMTRQQRDTALSAFHSQGVFCIAEAAGGTFGDENLPGQLPEDEPIRRWLGELAEPLGIRPMADYDGSPVYKVVFLCREEAQLKPAREALEKDFLFRFQWAPPGVLCGELINRKFDKGRGVLRVCSHLGLNRADTYGFGDSLNDLEMLQAVGFGVAMASGNAQLQAAADYISPPPEADGLAKTFAHLGLI